MKLATLSYVLTIGAALSLMVVGCKKGPEKITYVPKGASSTVGGDLASGPRDIGPGGTPAGSNSVNPGGVDTSPLSPSGDSIPQTGKNFDDWIPNRDEFKDQTVYFDYDKSNIKPSELTKLEEVAKRMKSSFQGKALKVEGYCDERGTEEYNRSLGDRRAQTIRETLVQIGLDATMVPTISFGEDKPADAGHDDAAWKKNRRGELILLSPPGGN